MMKKIAQTGIVTLGLMLMTVQGAVADPVNKWNLGDGTSTTVDVTVAEGEEGSHTTDGTVHITGEDGITTRLNSFPITKGIVIGIDKKKILATENVKGGKNVSVANKRGEVTVNLKDDVTVNSVTTDTLAVNNNSIIGGTLGVNGDTELKNTSVDGTLGVTGKATLNSGLAVASGDTDLKNTNIDGTLGVTGDSSLKNTAVDGTLGVTGKTALNELEVKGALTAKEEAAFEKLATMKEGFKVTGGDTSLKNTSVDGTLGVNGKATLNDGLAVASGDTELKNTSVDGTLGVTGDATFNNNATVKKDLNVEGTSNLKNTDIHGKLRVAENAEISGNLLVAGDNTTLGSSFVNKNLTVKGNTKLKGKLDVTGEAKFNEMVTMLKGLEVTGNATFNDNATVKKDLTVEGTSSIKDTNVNGNLDVTGEAKFNEMVTMLKGLEVTGNATFNDNATVKKDLTVEGTSNLKDTNVDGNLDVTGETNLHGNATVDKNLDVKGDTNLQGKLGVIGDTALGGTLEVTGATHLKNTLRVDGVASFNRDVIVNGHTSLNSLTVNNRALFRSGADMGGNRIINVAPGEVSPVSSDAINGSQLWAVQDKLNKAGARNAAMSNLNPMSYDDNARTSFAFSVGNYAGETAVALGLHHYFSRDTLLSLSGTMGKGDNMLSAGLSFRLGRSSKETLTAKAGSVTVKTDPFILERLERLEAENAEMRKANASMQVQLFKMSQ